MWCIGAQESMNHRYSIAEVRKRSTQWMRGVVVPLQGGLFTCACQNVGSCWELLQGGEALNTTEAG